MVEPLLIFKLINKIRVTFCKRKIDSFFLQLADILTGSTPSYVHSILILLQISHIGNRNHIFYSWVCHLSEIYFCPTQYSLVMSLWTLPQEKICPLFVFWYLRKCTLVRVWMNEWYVFIIQKGRSTFLQGIMGGGGTKRRQVLLNKYILRRTDRNWKKNTYLLKYSLEYICVALEVPLCEEHWLMAFLINDNTICNPEHAWERVRINYTGRTDVSQDCLLQTRAYGYPLYLCTLSLMVALEMIYFISTTKL